MTYETTYISNLLEINHKSICNLIERNKEYLETYGELYEKKIQHGKLGGRPKAVYILNESQKNLLIMLTKNNKITVDKKMEILNNLKKRE